MSRIKQWSFSRDRIFRECQLHAKFKYVDKIPEPERIKLPAGQEYPNDRGTRIHDEAEHYIRGKRDKLSWELRHFKEEFDWLRDLYKLKVPMEMEQMWCFDEGWVVVDEDDPKLWVRIKLDLIIWDGPAYAILVDYKTGKKMGNEIKHAEQLQLYQLSAFLRYPKLQEVTTELWYPDCNELTSMTYRRAQGLRYLKQWNQRGLDITTATIFPARPSEWACRFCNYKTGFVGKGPTQGTGHCKRNP